MPYGDESYKMIINTTALEEDTPQELVPFFRYINNMEVPDGDEFIKELHEQVKKYNTSEWRRRLMTLEEEIKMELEMERKQAFSEGEAQGEARGKAEGEAIEK